MEKVRINVSDVTHGQKFNSQTGFLDRVTKWDIWKRIRFSSNKIGATVALHWKCGAWHRYWLNVAEFSAVYKILEMKKKELVYGIYFCGCLKRCSINWIKRHKWKPSRFESTPSPYYERCKLSSAWPITKQNSKLPTWSAAGRSVKRHPRHG
jgi:hypothetical protein